ncbi:alpha-galactosidase [Mycetocola sp. JXN-3]|uniref:alpha-galactosidase n=1 Tax=Mycetocola sp. JXN-3 TaxID=2116510 RepID=UPI00165D1AC6|nr:alpha-galactosidase [Mycetocola sp. JXN-3]
MNNTPASPIHLSAAGVSVVLDVVGDELPAVIHWGEAIPAGDGHALEDLRATALPAVVNSSFDQPRRLGILPAQSDGWSGVPGIEAARGGRSATRFELLRVESDTRSARFWLREAATGLEVVANYELSPAGVLAVRFELVAAESPLGAGGSADGVSLLAEDPADAILALGAVRALLPVPERARDIFDFTGRWSGERRPQRTPLSDGGHVRATHRGRPGHDAAYLTLLGTPGFENRSGEIWATHVAWSGSLEQRVDRLPEGAGALTSLIGGGELLEPGEIRLRAGERYVSPEVLFAWSNAGIDGISARFHAYSRALAAHPEKPRPLVLNTWEAVYFDQNFETLARLADTAAEIGVERFVLDDGWFRARRDDTAGLGDWFVDEGIWPGGLGKLAAHVHGLGLGFGLWFEPEMVNLDSDLARAHPEWILADERQLGRSWRHQHVLNIAHPEAYRFIYDRISALVREYGINFIKWDHNRELHAAIDRTTGTVRVHEQTRALYRMFAELRAEFPELELESCASGGARVDLGIMGRAQRVWASDTNDPIERRWIHRWTAALLPPEVIGVHVGPEEAHTTHRWIALPYRLITALFGHAGIEWDITSCTPEERAMLTAWTALYRELRPVLHAGTSVHADGLDAGAALHGVVASDGSRAIYAWERFATSAVAHTPRVRFPGLDPEARYRVAIRREVGPAQPHQVADPEWLPTGESAPILSGFVLGVTGVPLPLLNPGNALLFDLVRA